MAPPSMSAPPPTSPNPKRSIDRLGHDKAMEALGLGEVGGGAAFGGGKDLQGEYQGPTLNLGVWRNREEGKRAGGF